MNSPIPAIHTGEGEDRSPALEWFGLPPHCKRLAVICDDPDAPARRDQDYPFVHWIIYNIPVTLRGLPEHINPRVHPAHLRGVIQGPNSFGKNHYNGPMPPRGSGVHHYIFTLYALDGDFDFPEGLAKDDLLKEMNGHIIATAKLVGTYERPAKAERKPA